MNKLLIVEDNNDLRENMRWALKAYYTICEAETVDECTAVFKAERPEMVCLDMGLDNVPDGGLQLIDSLLLIDRMVKIVVITANTSSRIGPVSSGGRLIFLINRLILMRLKWCSTGHCASGRLRSRVAGLLLLQPILWSLSRGFR